METLFEYRQRDSSWGDNVELVEFKVFENGKLYYNIDIEGRFLKNETKAANAEFAECIKSIVERKSKVVNNLPSELQNDKGPIKTEFVKIGSKKIFGHDWKRIEKFNDSTELEQKQDTLIKVLEVFQKCIEKFYPDFIAWCEVGESNWFKPVDVWNTYILDGTSYLVINGKDVYFNLFDFESNPADNITVDQLEMYGMCTDETSIELKINSIKEFKSPEWKALISADDGAGLEISFWDEDYFDHPEIYKIGEIGVYILDANIESEPEPQINADGAILTGEEMQKYSDYLDDEFDSADEKYICTYQDYSRFEKTSDFETSGKYKFNAVINDTYAGSDFCHFSMPLMNQYDKEKPRRLCCMLFNNEALFEKFRSIEPCDGLCGELYISARKSDSKNICRYGKNCSLTFYEKYPDTSEWE